MINFASYPLWINLLIFLVGGVVIWLAGMKLERYVDQIAQITGLGRAFAGLVLLAGATSLPEIATTVTASTRGNVTLAVNNLMGGVAMQTALLAIADWSLARGKLTYFTPGFTLLLQGVSLMLLLGIAIAGMASGEDFAIGRIGAWPLFILLVYLLLLFNIYRYRGNPRWQAVDLEELKKERDQIGVKPRELNTPPADSAVDENIPKMPLATLLLLFSVGSALIFLAGWTLTGAAEVLIDKLQLSASFVGAVLVAIATSLPEISTTTAAVRSGNYSMAISNIFGTNMIEVALLFVADLGYREGSLITGGGQQAMFMAALGLVVTGVYLWGLLERENRALLRIGLDSGIVLLLYFGGLVVLYQLG